MKLLRILLVLTVIFSFSVKGYTEEKQKSSNIEEHFISIVKDLKSLDWKSAVGGEIILEDNKKSVIVGDTLLYQTPKEYFSLNAIFPSVYGVSFTCNLKKVGGDIYFKYIRKNLAEEGRKELEEKFSWLSFIRIDVGYFVGYDSTGYQHNGRNKHWVHGVAFKVIKFEF